MFVFGPPVLLPPDPAAALGQELPVKPQPEPPSLGVWFLGLAQLAYLVGVQVTATTTTIVNISDGPGMVGVAGVSEVVWLAHLSQVSWVTQPVGPGMSGIPLWPLRSSISIMRWILLTLIKPLLHGEDHTCLMHTLP